MQKVDGILEKICFSSYPESVNCINVIQELKETISVAYKLTEDCDRHLNPSQYEKCEEISTASLCSASLISGKRVRLIFALHILSNSFLLFILYSFYKVLDLFRMLLKLIYRILATLSFCLHTHTYTEYPKKSINDLRKMESDRNV